MADTKISALVALTGVLVDTAADSLPIVDASAGATKQIIVDELRIALGIATQAQMETGASLVTNVTPGRQQYHPSAAKFWAFVTVSVGTPTLAANYNVTGIVDDSVGVLTITIGTDFSSANWCPNVSAGAIDSATTTYSVGVEAIAAGSVQVTFQRADGVQSDPERWGVCGFGDQA